MLTNMIMGKKHTLHMQEIMYARSRAEHAFSCCSKYVGTYPRVQLPGGWGTPVHGPSSNSSIGNTVKSWRSFSGFLSHPS